MPDLNPAEELTAAEPPCEQPRMPGVADILAILEKLQAHRPAPTAETSSTGPTWTLPAGAGVIICYSRCWVCMFGQCYDPPRPHPWWDSEDVEAAEAAGSSAPAGNCACPCAREAEAAS